VAVTKEVQFDTYHSAFKGVNCDTLPKLLQGKRRRQSSRQPHLTSPMMPELGAPPVPAPGVALASPAPAPVPFDLTKGVSGGRYDCQNIL